MLNCKTLPGTKRLAISNRKTRQKILVNFSLGNSKLVYNGLIVYRGDNT